ncbi:hypothetical protein [Streptomyces bohaiensis]|uniref:Sortase n=1 Tax=Streptomyces bohaiensis TaxID=1431344 RepID=A0ABX1C4B1_9ACTN|nr:hypothetical protein [Streptomyces bohaiensis]NJQ14070.1 hypothetical protein [Streptomyces bohaiensis]
MRLTRHGRGLATATAVLISLGLATGAAHAQDDGTVELFPNPAHPGDAVAVNTADCDGDDTARGDATTVGGGTFTLRPGVQPEILVGGFTVPSRATAGDYGIGVTCANGDVITGTLRVVQAGSTTSPTASPTSTPTATASPTATPTTTASPTAPSGGVSGGVGGPDGTVGVIAGSAAVLFAVGAGSAWVLRRRAASADR